MTQPQTDRDVETDKKAYALYCGPLGGEDSHFRFLSWWDSIGRAIECAMHCHGSRQPDFTGESVGMCYRIVESESPTLDSKTGDFSGPGKPTGWYMTLVLHARYFRAGTQKPGPTLRGEKDE